MRANFDARREHTNLAAESHVLKDEMTALQAALADADTTFEDLKAQYANGLVHAPCSAGLSVQPCLRWEASIGRASRL